MVKILFYNTLPVGFIWILTYIWSVSSFKITQLKECDIRLTGWLLCKLFTPLWPVCHLVLRYCTHCNIVQNKLIFFRYFNNLGLLWKLENNKLVYCFKENLQRLKRNRWRQCLHLPRTSIFVSRLQLLKSSKIHLHTFFFVLQARTQKNIR